MKVEVNIGKRPCRATMRLMWQEHLEPSFFLVCR